MNVGLKRSPAEVLEAWPKPRIAAQTCYSACKQQYNRCLECCQASQALRAKAPTKHGPWDCNQEDAASTGRQILVVSLRSILEAPLLQRAAELWEPRT